MYSSTKILRIRRGSGATTACQIFACECPNIVTITLSNRKNLPHEDYPN